MKVIDLLNKIANGEEVPEIIEFDNTKYYFRKIYKEYYRFDNSSTLYRDYNVFKILNDEVEILDEEDEFIDIEEFNIIYNLDYIDYRNIDVLKNYLNKDFQDIFDTLDKLIKNQKKIIEKLKEK